MEAFHFESEVSFNICLCQKQAARKNLGRAIMDVLFLTYKNVEPPAPSK